MNKGVITAQDIFLAALTYQLSKEGRGAQKRVATVAGISPSTLNDILHHRTRGSEDVKRRIVQAFDMSYESFLRLGRRHLNLPLKKSDIVTINLGSSTIKIRIDDKAADYLMEAVTLLKNYEKKGYSKPEISKIIFLAKEALTKSKL